KAGQPVQVRIGNEVLPGTIEQILPAVENNAIQFRIALSNPEADILRPNMEVDVRIVTDVKKNGLFIPNGPAIRGGKSQKLFVVRDGMAIARQVETGMRTTERVEIISGLEPGDVVLLSDMSAYENRQKIRLK